jgi:hypothetical protein
LNDLHETFGIVFTGLEEAYQRDANIAHNLLESHFSANGCLTVRKETHDYLERFKKEVLIDQRFTAPEVLPYQENVHFNPIMRTYGTSSKNDHSTYQYRAAESQQT